jgi:hypothetical protein
MKKVFAAIVVAALVGVTSSWAFPAIIVTNVLEKMDITLKGNLSPDGGTVNGVSLAGNTSPISILDLQIISSGPTTNEAWGIGQIAPTTNLFLSRTVSVDWTAGKNDKFVLVLTGTHGSATNAVLLLKGASKTTVKNLHTNTTINATFKGIWNDEVSAVEGSIASVNPPR